MVGRDALELGGRRLRPDAVEELTDLPLPAPQVLAKDPLLVGVRDLVRAEALSPAAEEKAAVNAGGAEVPHPLSLAPRRDEIALPLHREHVDRRAPRLSARAPAYLED